MEDSLSNRIAQRVKNKNFSFSAHIKNRAAFLAIREDIINALNDGWPVTIIWKTLYEEGKITFGYQTFHKYIDQLIPSVKVKTPQSLKNKIVPQSPKKKPSGISGFTYNPIPNEEELF